MVVTQGDVCRADLPDPAGSGPGFRHPVVVVQGDALNRSRIGTVVCVPLTSNVRWAEAPGNVMLTARSPGPKDSVVNVSQIITADRALLADRVGRVSRATARGHPGRHRARPRAVGFSSSGPAQRAPLAGVA